MAMRGTQRRTIRKFMRGDEISGHSRFYYTLSDGATADKATIVIWRDDGFNGERNMKRVGYITASVVDTEITFDETKCGTQSLTAIKQVEQYLLDLLAVFKASDKMQAWHPEPRTAPAPAPAEDGGRDVLVIPISRIRELVGKNINGYKITGFVVRLEGRGSYDLDFFAEDYIVSQPAYCVFDCDVEVIDE